MKSKRAIAVLLSLITVLSLFAGCRKKDNPQDNTTSQPVSGTSLKTEDTGTEAKPAEKFKPSFAALNDSTGFADYNGYSLYINNEILYLCDSGSGNTSVICNSRADDAIINEQKIIYSKRAEDKSVALNPDAVAEYNNFFKEDGGTEVKEFVYERDEFFSFDLKTEKSEKIFAANSFMTRLLYFDSSSLYYTDVRDDQIGYNNGFYVIGADILMESISVYRFDFGTKKSTKLFETSVSGSFDAWRAYEINGAVYFLYENEDEQALYDINGKKLLSHKNSFNDNLGEIYHFGVYCDGKLLYNTHKTKRGTNANFEIFSFDVQNKKEDRVYGISFTESAGDGDEGDYISHNLNRYCLCKVYNETKPGASGSAAESRPVKADFYDFETGKGFSSDISNVDKIIEADGKLYGLSELKSTKSSETQTMVYLFADGKFEKNYISIKNLAPFDIIHIVPEGYFTAPAGDEKFDYTFIKQSF